MSVATRSGSILIVGGGEGLGSSIARVFARESYGVAVAARTQESVTRVMQSIPGTSPRLPLTADASSDADVERVVGQAKEFFGSIDVVVYNAAAIRADKPTDLSAAEHRKLFEVNVLGALRLARLILPHPATEHTTTFLLTGGMPVAKSSYTSLSMGKAALRALTHALVEEYATERVRIGMITIDGAIAPGSRLDPDLIAEEYWRFHSSPTIPWYQELVMKP